MSSSSDRYDHTKVKARRSWTPLFLRRLFHRYPDSKFFVVVGGMAMFVFHQNIFDIFRYFYMSKEDFEAYKAENKRLYLRRVYYCEGIRIPFSKSTFNMYSPREVELMEERRNEKEVMEKKLLEELNPFISKPKRKD